MALHEDVSEPIVPDNVIIVGGGVAGGHEVVVTAVQSTAAANTTHSVSKLATTLQLDNWLVG
jgi:hypothetical protein